MKMKYLIINSIFLLFAVTANSQENTKKTEPKQKVESEQSNTLLMNTYIKKRKQSSSKYSKEISPNDQKELDSIVDILKKQDPESYEYNYLEVINNEHSKSSFSNLEKASAISPNNAQLYIDYIIYYELTDNPAKKKQYCQKLFESNIYSNGLLEYSHNLLNSLEKNAILFTYGEHDTYPTILQQEVKNIRKDVTVLNLELLKDVQYRTNQYNKLKIKEPSTSIDNLINKTISENPNTPIYLSVTINPKLLTSLSQQLYITGLAFKHSKKEYKNIPELVNNWEYKFKTDELAKPTENLTLNRIHLNYSIPLIILYKYYGTKNKTSQQKKVKKLLLKIAKEGNKVAEIEQYINEK